MTQLDKTMFADEIRCKYPINTKEASLASYSDAKSAGDIDRPDIREKFDKAASFYGIKWPEQEKQSSAPDVTFDIGDKQLSMGKIASADDALKAGNIICGLRSEKQRIQLKEAALHVLARASELDSDLDNPVIRKIAHIAGVGVGDRVEIEHEFEKRATLNDFAGSNKAFWDAVNEIKALSDEDFYKQANLEYMCSTLEDIDGYFSNSHRYGKDLKAPEDVVFSSTVDDLLKEASDLMYVESADATLSKKALLERSGAVNGFFKSYFNQKEDLEGDKLIEKVASCDKTTFRALISSIEA